MSTLVMRDITNTQVDAEVVSEETICAICHTPITRNQRDQYLPCAHRYHAVCMEEYGAAMKSPWQDLPCPTCKIVPAHVQAPEQDRQDMDSLDSDMNLDDDVSTTIPTDDDNMPPNDDIEITILPAPKAEAKAKAKASAKAKAKAKAKAQHAMIPPVHPTMYGATFAYG